MAVERRFPRRVDVLPDIFDFTAAFYAAEAVGERARYVLDFTTEELFTNFVKYGGGSRDILIRIERTTADDVLVTMVDQDAKRFDVTLDRGVDTSAPLEDRVPGGLGLHLLNRMVDEIGYRFDADGTTITYRKHRGA